MEGYGRKKLKTAKIGKNLWSKQNSGRPIDLAGQPIQTEAQRCGAGP